MRKLIPLLAGGAIFLLANTGCNQGMPMDATMIAAKADSMYNARRAALVDSMNKNCNDNMAAWVQAKADSIYNANAAAMQK